MRHSALNIQHMKLKSFTLIELMVVIGIIGILVTMVVKNIGGAMDGAEKLETAKSLEAVGAACQSYKMEYGEEPFGLSGSNPHNLVLVLKADGDTCDVNDNQKNPRYIKMLDSKILTKTKTDGSLDTNHYWDKWENRVNLGSTSKKYYLVSAGPDGEFQTTTVSDSDPTADGDDVIYLWNK